MLECAKIAQENKNPLHFNIIRYTDIDNKLSELSNVTITGRYTEATIFEVLSELNCDVAWFPAVWPETFSFTLSIALEAGIFPVAFDIGAISSRLRELEWGYLMPVGHMTKPDEIIDVLNHVEITAPPVNLTNKVTQRYDDLQNDYYELQPHIFASV